jgi:hypothetical protein
MWAARETSRGCRSDPFQNSDHDVKLLRPGPVNPNEMSTYLDNQMLEMGQ